MSRQLSIGALLIGGSLLVAGCGGDDTEGRPDVVPVKGTVMYNGAPVAGATVTFVGEGAPRPATGVTNAKGEFQLTMYEPNDGAMPGPNVITVTKREAGAAPAAAPTSTSGGPPSAIELGRMNEIYREGSENADAPKSLIPEIYGNPTTTPLKETVTADGDNVFPLQLSD